MTPPLFEDMSLRRAASRRAFLRGSLAISAGAGAIAVGCGGDSADPTSTPGGAATARPTAGGATPMATAAAGEATAVPGVRPSLLTSEFVQNENNRFAIGLLAPDGGLVTDAQVYVRFFKIGADGISGSLRGEGGMQQVKLDVTGENAETITFFAANAPFGESGQWGVDIDVTPAAGEPATVQIPFEVKPTFTTPANGTTPPASVNDTVATTPDIASLCSRTPSQCELHDKTIAELLGAGRPFVVQFSTPAYCQTRFCGPVLDVLLGEVPAYRDRIDFVHIEVWQDFQAKVTRPAINEWKLPTEPYTFFIGADRKVRGRLEAIFGNEELRAKLDGLLT